MSVVATPDQIAERHRLGLDRFDEIWDGRYHVNAAPHPRHSFLLRHAERLLDERAEAKGLVPLGEFNIGTPSDYRIPDAGYVDALPTEAFVPTARLVVEVLSPNDETLAKLPFYAHHRVDEVLLIDLAARTVTWLALDELRTVYATAERSALLNLSADDVSAHLPWNLIDP
jgi:Uma2 family endonuclease